MFSKNIRVIFISTLFLFVISPPIFAQTISCPKLQEMSDRVGDEIVQLLAEYPGTHIALATCMYGAEEVYKSEHDAGAATITFGGCAFLACYLAGTDNCMSVGKRWLNLTIQKVRIDQIGNRSHCT